MYTPHTVTLFNAIEDAESLEMSYNMTVLDGVFLDCTERKSNTNTGAQPGNTVTLYIPFNVTAKDVFTAAEKLYQPPKVFDNADDKSTLWTLKSAGESSGAACYFVKGIVPEAISYGKLKEAYDDVYDISSVRTLDYGSADMQHWMVTGS